MNDLKAINLTPTNGIEFDVYAVIKKEVQEKTPKSLMDFVASSCRDIQQQCATSVHSIQNDADAQIAKLNLEAGQRLTSFAKNAEYVFNAVNCTVKKALPGSVLPVIFDLIVDEPMSAMYMQDISIEAIIKTIKEDGKYFGFFETIRAIQSHLGSLGYGTELTYLPLDEPVIASTRHVGYFTLTITFPQAFVAVKHVIVPAPILHVSVSVDNANGGKSAADGLIKSDTNKDKQVDNVSLFLQKFATYRKTMLHSDRAALKNVEKILTKEQVDQLLLFSKDSQEMYLFK